MSERVRVLHDDDGRLVAAKASPGFDPSRVEREAVLLEHVRHPGVVELVGLRSGSVGAEVWTRWVGARSAADLPRPLPPARIAGLVLAVGATLTDLHRSGVVHGAIEATHVLLDPFGRPVLCGFGRAARFDQPLGPSDDSDDPDPLPARPSVDVAGLGGLLTELLDDADASRPGRSATRPRRPGRGRAAQVRALREVAAQATVPDPRDRPGLQAVLDGVRRAVPEAALVDVDPPGADGATSAGRPSPAGARGTPHGAAREPNEMRDGDTRATGIPDLTDELVGDGDELDDDPVAALLRSVLTPTPAPAPAARTTTTDPIHPPQPASTEFDDLWIDAPRVGGPSPIPLLDQLDRLRPTDDVDRDPRSLRRLTTAGVAVVVAAVGFVGMSSVVGGAGPGDPAPVSAAPFASSAPTSEAIAGSPTTTSAPTSTSPDPTASGAVADDGAAPAPIVEHEGRRFQVGEPGDLTAVADWRCDGRQTLALYRPATGATFVFDSWPRPGERAETTAVVVAPGGSGLEPGIDGTGCPTLSVVGTTGPLTTLTVEDLR